MMIIEVLLGLFLTIALASQLKIASLMSRAHFKNTMIAEMKMEDVLSSIMAKTLVDRALVAKIHNGGSFLQIGGQKKVSVVIEPADSLEPHTKSVYTSYPIDNNYLRVISEMMESDAFLFNRPEDLAPGIYRTKVKGDGIRGIFHFKGAASKTGIYYIFLATTRDPELILSDPKQMAIIIERTTLIRKLCTRAINKKFLI